MKTIRTNIRVDKELVEQLMLSTGARTKRQLVHEALLALRREQAGKEFLALSGKIKWEGDLSQMRRKDADDELCTNADTQLPLTS